MKETFLTQGNYPTDIVATPKRHPKFVENRGIK